MKKQRSLRERYDELSQDFGQTPICEASTIRRAEPSADGGDREMDFVISTSGIKRDGLEVVPKGMINRDFRGNPLVLFMHGYFGPNGPVARSVKEWVTRSKELGAHVRATGRFLEETKEPFAEQLRLMYEDGDMNATSIRWHDDGEGSTEEIPEDELPENVPTWVKRWGGLRFLRWHLVEWSLVTLPMDKKALAIRAEAGGIDPRFRDLLVPQPKLMLPEDRLPDGSRAIMRFDGQPIEVDRPFLIDMGQNVDDPPKSSPERTAEGPQGPLPEIPATDQGTVIPGKVEYAFDLSNERKVIAAVQRLMQGRVAEEQQESLKEALSTHFDGGTMAWKTPSGRAYVALHQQLSEVEAGKDKMEAVEVERVTGALRTAVVQLATELFGADRRREAWEPRPLPRGDESVWASVCDALDGVLVDVVVEREDRDACIDSLLRSLDSIIGAHVRLHDWHEDVGIQIANILSLPLEGGNDAQRDAVIRVIRELLAPVPKEQGNTNKPPEPGERELTQAEALRASQISDEALGRMNRLDQSDRKGSSDSAGGKEVIVSQGSLISRLTSRKSADS